MALTGAARGWAPAPQPPTLDSGPLRPRVSKTGPAIKHIQSRKFRANAQIQCIQGERRISEAEVGSEGGGGCISLPPGRSSIATGVKQRDTDEKDFSCPSDLDHIPLEIEFVIDNLLIRIHYSIVMMR